MSPSWASPASSSSAFPNTKTPRGSSAARDDGIVQEAIRLARKVAPDLLVITDLCFCEYTDHGHCGPLTEIGGRVDVDNDATLPLLAEQAVSHARAGADMIAPSGMMDGMVTAIRQGLDDSGFTHLPIMSYAAKFASGYYGPFRDAAESTPSFGDRRTYQMDPANGAKPCARSRSTWPKEPTSSWSSPPSPTSTSSIASRKRAASRWRPTTSRASTP